MDIIEQIQDRIDCVNHEEYISRKVENTEHMSGDLKHPNCLRHLLLGCTFPDFKFREVNSKCLGCLKHHHIK